MIIEYTSVYIYIYQTQCRETEAWWMKFSTGTILEEWSDLRWGHILESLLQAAGMELT